MHSIKKQPYEEFYLSGTILRVQQTGESIVLANSTVTATDKDGTDVTSTITKQSTMKVLTHPDSASGVRNNALSVLVRAGSAAASPYKITYKMATDMSHKWEVDIYMYIEEL